MAQTAVTEKTQYQGQMHLLQKELMGRYFERVTRAAEQGEGKAVYMLISGNPVELIQAFDPTHAHLNVEVGAIIVCPMPAHGVGELIHADDIILRHHRPIIRVAINARDLIGRELEDLELDARAFECLSEWHRHQQEAGDRYER